MFWIKETELDHKMYHLSPLKKIIEHENWILSEPLSYYIANRLN